MTEKMRKHWKKVSWRIGKKSKKKFFESNLLKLNCNKAKSILQWKCILSFNETVNMTVNWYKNYYSEPKKIYETSLNQIKEYERLLKTRLIK